MPSDEVRVVADCAYPPTSVGLHRFVDPTGGAVDLHTQFEPFDPPTPQERVMARREHGALRDLAGELATAAGRTVVLSGAGVSVSSDVPAFRDPGGLWDRYDPFEYATLEAFVRRPGQVWEMLRDLDRVLDSAAPNPAHRALARLEHAGLVEGIITQNVDGLHQQAGSRHVIELHGSRFTLSCLDCDRTVARAQVIADVRDGQVPRCEGCGGLLKPDVVFFGEALPAAAISRARQQVRRCELLLVVGTSAEVYPAAELPLLAADSGARVWEINPEPAVAGARSVPRPAEDALPRLVDLLRERRGG